MALKRVITLILISMLAAPLGAAGLLGKYKQSVNPDYSKSVWDSVMERQSYSDVRSGFQYMAMYKYDEAVNSFAKAVIKNPKDPNVYLYLGMGLYWSGKIDAAINEYNTAIKMDKKNADAYQLLGIAYGWKGDTTKAAELFEKADELNPKRSDIKLNLSSVYMAFKEYEKALDNIRMGTALSPRDPLLFYQQGLISDVMGRDLSAEEAFKKAIKLYPYYEDAMLSLGALYEKRSEDKDALTWYKKAVRTKPGDFVARLRYANLLAVTGKTKEAREVLVKAFAITSSEGKGLALNLAYSGVKKPAQSQAKLAPQLETLKNSLSRLPAGTEVRIETEVSYQSKNLMSNTKEMTALEREMRMRAAEKELQSLPAMSRTFILSASEEDERAVQIQTLTAALQKVLDTAPDGKEVNLNIKTDIIDSQPKMTQSDQATAYNPRTVGNDMGVWKMGRSWVMLIVDVMEDIEDRIEDAEAAGKQAQAMDYILFGLGALTVGKGAEAKAAFNNALTLAPEDEIALLGKGTALIVIGDEDGAAEIYKQVLTLNPKNKIAAANLEYIEKGKK
ncbi:tetratricopeptide (TPR) repeat protein [Elusimicrobium simillimum]|uniref:tetratricopeptide repeat protein n=1 Tax=Elusimicrobium simillimum TaxID=3143438 RepID=UPI003C6EB707